MRHACAMAHAVMRPAAKVADHPVYDHAQTAKIRHPAAEATQPCRSSISRSSHLRRAYEASVQAPPVRRRRYQTHRQGRGTCDSTERGGVRPRMKAMETATKKTSMTISRGRGRGMTTTGVIIPCPPGV